eukprot:754102-Hanusia_phi.AAC.1
MSACAGASSVETALEVRRRSAVKNLRMLMEIFPDRRPPIHQERLVQEASLRLLPSFPARKDAMP